MFIKLSGLEVAEIKKLEDNIRSALSDIISSRGADPDKQEWQLKRASDTGDMYLVAEEKSEEAKEKTEAVTAEVTTKPEAVTPAKEDKNETKETVKTSN